MVNDTAKLLLEMDLPMSNDKYAVKDYWDERYMEEVDYDWFSKYDAFAHHIAGTINRSDRILQLGMPLPISRRIRNLYKLLAVVAR